MKNTIIVGGFLKNRRKRADEFWEKGASYPLSDELGSFCLCRRLCGSWGVFQQLLDFEKMTLFSQIVDELVSLLNPKVIGPHGKAQSLGGAALRS